MIRLLSGTVLMLMAMTMGGLHVAFTGDVTLAQAVARLEHVNVFLLGLFLFVTGVEDKVGSKSRPAFVLLNNLKDK